MKKFFRIFLWVIIGLIFVGTFVFLYLNSQEKETKYETVKPTFTSIERTSVLTGNIEPRDEINIKPQISGIISEVLVEAGDMVKEGDVIAKIKVIPEASSLSQTQGQIDQATIQLEDAKNKLDRAKALYDKKVISREEYETTETTYRQAERNLSTAKDALNIVKNGVSRYNASEANTMVRATISGLVLDVPVKVGSSVIQSNTFNDGTTIAVIADMNNLIFKGKVDETEVGKLRPGMQLKITVGALPEFTPTATLEYISPKSSNASGANTFEIKAAVTPDPNVQLRSGYSANATVTLDGTDRTLTLPESVIKWSGDSTFVYVLTDSATQKFERRSIVTGLSNGINIEIKEGVDSTVVVRGAKIKD